MTKRPRHRKKLYVSGAIQGRILWRVGIYWAAYHLFLLHLLFLGSGLMVGEHLTSFGDKYRAFFVDNLMLLACATAVFPVIFWDMLKITNRVAGPFVRFERALKDMARGQRVEKVTLREHDMVHEFLAVFNQFIEYRNRELDANNAGAQNALPHESADHGRAEPLGSEDARVADTLSEIQRTVVSLQSGGETAADDGAGLDPGGVNESNSNPNGAPATAAGQEGTQ